MRTENINHEFLDPVVAGSQVDVYHHFGVTSDDPVLERLRGVTAVVMAGSGDRIKEFAGQWSDANGGSEIVAFSKEDRFVTRYTAGVMFCSHGMGMPSAAIALQEAMRLVFFLKRGNLAGMDEVFWARVGTCGGVGLPGGTVVVSSEGVMADLRPYRLLQGGTGEYWFDGTYPQVERDAIVAASAGCELSVTTGKTVSANDYFLEAFGLDGAIRLDTYETKVQWLRWLYDNGVRTIEMEGAMFAGYLNHWGFSRFAMICCTLLDCLEGDQVTASPERLHAFTADGGRVLFNHLHSRHSGSA